MVNGASSPWRTDHRSSLPCRPIRPCEKQSWPAMKAASEEGHGVVLHALGVRVVGRFPTPPPEPAHVGVRAMRRIRPSTCRCQTPTVEGSRSWNRWRSDGDGCERLACQKTVASPPTGVRSRPTVSPFARFGIIRSHHSPFYRWHGRIPLRGPQGHFHLKPSAAAPIPSALEQSSNTTMKSSSPFLSCAGWLPITPVAGGTAWASKNRPPGSHKGPGPVPKMIYC